MARVYAAMRSGLLVVEDGSVAGRALGDRAIEAVAAPDAETVFVGTFESGLHRSTDGGATFERVGAERLPPAVTALAVDPHDGGLWVGTEPSRVFHSPDGGETFDPCPGLTDLPSASEWSFPPRPHTHHVRWIEPDPHDEGHLYVGIEAGALVRTTDGGESWQDRPENARRDNHSLATHPDAPGSVWAAAGDGYAESPDGGDTWVAPWDGLEHRYCWSVAVDAGDPTRVLVSAADGARAAHSAPGESYVYRKVEGSAWSRLDGRGLPMGTGVLRAVIAPGAPGEFYALNDCGLYRTADGGDAWTAVLDDLGRHGGETARGLVVV